MVERRKKKFWNNPIILVIITTLVIVPVNTFALKTVNLFNAPQEIQIIKKEVQGVSKDVEELKIKLDKHDKNMNDLEKIVIRLQVITERLENHIK